MSRRALLCLVASLALVGLFAVPTRAQTSNAEKQQQLKNQILEATASEQAALQQLQDIQARKAPLDARAVALDAQMREVQAKLAPLEDQVAQLAAALADAQARFEQKQAEFEVAKAEVERSAAQIYRSARRGATYDYVTAARPENLVQGAKYLDQVNQNQRDVVHKVTVLRDEIDTQRKGIQAKKVDAEAAAAEVQKVRDQIASLQAELAPVRAQVAAEATAEQNQITSIRNQKTQWEREWAELQAISDSIAAQLRLNPTPGAPAGACNFRPVPGPIVSGFGTRNDPLGGGTGFHAGLDIAASSGTPIRACRAGTVVIASWQGGYGNAVVIDHGGGMATLYGHQSSMAVSVGTRVLAGEVIGYVGSTGNSTGPHLHFEVRIAGNPVNPVGYI